MHHRILLKVKGDSQEEAESNARMILEDTLRCHECEQSRQDVNWDYVGDINLVDEAQLIKWNQNGGFDDGQMFKTPEELAQYLIAQRAKAIENTKQRAKETYAQNIEVFFMGVEDAPLHTNPESTGAPVLHIRAKEILDDPNKARPWKPLKTKEEFLDALIELRNQNSLDMGGYYMRKIRELQKIMEYGDKDDGLYTLHSTDNHYADMTNHSSYFDGENTYYFWCDRHH